MKLHHYPDLGTLGGISSTGYSINDAGEVVGYSYTGADVVHAFIYTDGMMHDLNSLLPDNSGWVLENAYAINDAAQITGIGMINGHEHAFLLTPTPEPGAFAVGFFVAVGLLRRRRNRSRD